VEQIIDVLKEAEAGMPVAELIQRIGTTEQALYRWKKWRWILHEKPDEPLIARSGPVLVHLGIVKRQPMIDERVLCFDSGPGYLIVGLGHLLQVMRAGHQGIDIPLEGMAP
jgi:hypothetical protein